MLNEQQIFDYLRKGNEEAFSFLFRKYYKDLVLFAGTILPGRKELCEDIVQDVFMDLWNHRNERVIKTSVKGFLLQSVRNGCLDELRHEGVVRVHAEYMAFSGIDRDWETEEYILYSDLENHLKKGLNRLPEECRNVLVLSRIEGLKYKEIAAKLQISERTVEERMAKALKFLRRFLSDFLFWGILILYWWF
ncbi:RNA polymerase sigma-70 factor [Tannerella sp.]|uniref:RNA polymerase sigma-70 factor n=1 Tax=Tannerella sp. TaxID=2382127 RepID=UPI0026DCBD48|nr:RNA polymerase sigma-70 factor [Tannerella sp.]MDO4702789.1 RNA polymerase sigma-70 factor [Tannerella sp.]